MARARDPWKLQAYAAATRSDAVALSIGGRPAFASTRSSATVEGWQFVCDQGPSVEAFLRNAPTGSWDTADAARRWPWLADAMGRWPFGAVYALPIAIGDSPLAALTLYWLEPGTFSVDHRSAVAACVRLARQELLAALLGTGAHELLGQYDTFNRAIGVVASQTGLTPEQAVEVVRAHAYASGHALSDVLEDIVGLRLRLDAT